MAKRLIRMVYVMTLLALTAAGGLLTVGVMDGIRDWCGPNRLIVPLRLDRTATAQLFYDRGAGIRGEDCVSVPLAGGTAMRELAFAVPREPLRELRFDPMPFPGKFAIGAPRLESASGRVIARFPLTAVVPRHEITGWRKVDAHWEGAGTGDDPQLTLGLGEPLRVGRPRMPWAEALGVAGVLVAMIIVRRYPAARDWQPVAAARAWLWRRRAWLAEEGAIPLGAGAAVVALGQLWLLWPLHRVIDWPLWDEPNYAARGVAWAAHGGSLAALHTSPLYVVMYAGLSRIGDLGAMICAQHYLAKLGSVVLLYFVLARWWRSWAGAAAVALLWAVTQYQLEFPQLVYHAAWLGFLAALLTADRRPLAALGFTVLAACVRQEYQLAAAGLLAWYGWRAWRQRWPWRAWLAQGRGWVGGAVLAAVVWSGAGYVLAHTDLLARESGARMWFAFEQHYAARAVLAGEVKGINPSLDYGALIQRDFPGADSLQSAWQVNAAGVRHHLGYNLTHVVGELAGLGRIHGGLETAAWVLLAGALLGLAATAGAKWPADTNTDGACVTASAVLAGVAFLAVAPGLIVLAKGSYLLALVPGVLGGAGWLWLRATKWTAAWRAVLGGGALVTLAVGGVILVRAPQPFVPGDRARPVAETVAELQKIWPATGREALLGVAATSYAQYLGEDRCEAVEALTGATGRAEGEVSIERVLAEVRPRAVLVTDEWRASPRFDGEKLARLLAGPEWTVREVPAGRLYVRVGK